MQQNQVFAVMALVVSIALPVQEKERGHEKPRPEDLPTSSLISEPGPSFVVPQSDLEGK